jgi:hypothetical protein
MAERGVSDADVERVLNAPIGAPQPGKRPDTLVLTGFNVVGLPLRVVVDSADLSHVISVLT